MLAPKGCDRLSERRPSNLEEPIVSRVVNLIVVAALLGGFGCLALPMIEEYRASGTVTVPVLGHTIDFKDLSASDNGSTTGVSRLSPSEALAKLNALPVKGKAAKTGYSRDQFGAAWTDKARGVLYAGNGCDTRDDILKRDMTNVTTGAVSSCPTGVLSGTLADPYTGKVIEFKRGAESATVQIDHIIPLGNAWVTGAQRWSAQKRVAFANDPRNLLAVDGPANGAKSDNDASGWLPPNKSARCGYAAAQVNVKAIYGLWVTSPEKNALSGVLAKCAA